MEFTVRDAEAGDAGPIAGLSGVLGYPIEPRAVRAILGRLLGRPDQRVYVAVSPSGAACGWLQAHSCEVLESGLRVEIMGLVVSPQARRRGVGRALVARAEAWASELGAGYVVVRSNVKREESHAFYPALGYSPSKTQAVYRKSLRA